jgi:phosphatidylethanolamine-binding protein (PEBP) family uncharacterized protein
MQLLTRTVSHPVSFHAVSSHAGSIACLISSVLVLACSDEDEPAVGAAGSSASGAAGAAAAGAGGATGNGGNAGANVSGGSAGVNSSGGTSSGSGGMGGSSVSDAGVGAGGEGADSGSAVAFVVSSPAFDNSPGCGPVVADRAACDLFPDENTGLGAAANVSPAISWTGAPAGTQSFAIALHDLVFLQGGDPFTHWVMWNIPGTATGLPAELPSGVMPGIPAANTQQVSFEQNDGFTGSGQCGNVYEFVLYALDSAAFVPPNANDQNAVQTALDGSDAVLDTATMRARSDPNGPSCNN